MRNFNSLLVIILSLLTLVSCQKDNDPPSNSELIIGKNWLITNYLVTEDKRPSYDLFAMPNITICTKDDIYKFSSDGKYIIDEGATRCFQNDPQIYQEGTWVIADNILKWTYAFQRGHFTETYTILELTPKQMVLERTFSEQGINYVLKITYTSK
ncbi:MAG: lipocalin family protein [Adhaeribacter sp.]